MGITQAPYRHADGSGCWTRNCSRNHQTAMVLAAINGDVAGFLEARSAMEQPVLKTSLLDFLKPRKTLTPEQTVNSFPTSVEEENDETNHRYLQNSKRMLELIIAGNKKVLHKSKSLYLFGQCYTYAMVHQMNNPSHQIKEIVDRDGVPVHVYTVDPKTGKAYDVRGSFRNEKSLVSKSLISYFTPKQLSAMDDAPTYDVEYTVVSVVSPEQLEARYDGFYVRPTASSIKLAAFFVNKNK